MVIFKNTDYNGSNTKTGKTEVNIFETWRQDSCDLKQTKKKCHTFTVNKNVHKMIKEKY